jgi:hypothetical protein
MSTSLLGTLLRRANAAASPQLAKADFASSSQHVWEGQRIAELDAEQRQALALGRGAKHRRSAGGVPGIKVASRRERVA